MIFTPMDTPVLNIKKVKKIYLIKQDGEYPRFDQQNYKKVFLAITTWFNYSACIVVKRLKTVFLCFKGSDSSKKSTNFAEL